MQKNNKTWVAYYAPAGHPDMTNFGFSTRENAVEYAKKFSCKGCLKEKDFEGSMCGCEWLFIEEEDFKKAENHGDLMESAGWKKTTKKELKNMSKNIKTTQIREKIGERMKKNYESPYLYKLPHRLPIIIRLDGKCFHGAAKNLKWKKPFDEELIKNLQKITQELCDEIMNVKLAYLQSDEISFLLIDYEKIETEPWFNNGIQKIVSVLAGLASAKLSLIYNTELSFDARVFVMPPWEVNNYFICRQKDWTRNSIQMLGRTYFSQSELQGLSCNEIQEKLWKLKNINWAKLPIHLKRGSCIVKVEELWCIDMTIPDFTKDKNYIEKFVPELNENK